MKDTTTKGNVKKTNSYKQIKNLNFAVWQENVRLIL